MYLCFLPVSSMEYLSTDWVMFFEFVPRTSVTSREINVQSSSGKVRLKFKRRVVIVGEKSRWAVVVVRGVQKEIVSTRKRTERIRAVRRVKSDVNFEEDRRSAGVRLKRSKEGGMLEPIYMLLLGSHYMV